ncbi:cation:proton antiporter regulatory subunit [Actinophytocola sp.]|uniref:cation:proton antiporter regulatory subunit n=1 Tax=Actinophytocola sp. TaxID=1872138 RepID=UPI003D6AA09C
MDVEVRRRDLPGLGKQFEIGCASGGRVAVVVQNNGARHLYTFEPDADAASSALQLDEAQARVLGAILAGVYFRPAEHDEPAVFGAVAIDWLTVEADAPALAVADLVLVDHPSATLVAIMRGEETLVKPGPDELLRAGDQILIAGHRADIFEVRAKIVEAART